MRNVLEAPSSAVGTDMLQAFQNALATGDFTVVEELEMPARPERREEVPPAYRVGGVGRWLLGSSFDNGIWTHQAEALRRFERGSNIVVATGTASGKSLVFQAAALRMLDQRPDCAVLVLYPLKALVADQLVSWRQVMTSAGLSQDAVGRLDGDVLADERLQIIEKSRIVVATPDVTHAWLMSNLARPANRRFLGRLALLIIDEAHVFEGVFGSNCAYLFRRLAVAARLAAHQANVLRVVAASATISNPSDHLAALTGLHFDTIDESLDGSPRHTRQIVHLACKAREEATIATELQKVLLGGSDRGSFITFVDSRQGAERLAIRTEAEDKVRPYRSGYEASDRQAIERALREGSLRGVVSTSALELGINIPHFSVGMNLGVPASRKSFRQRLGRVGRE